MIEEFAHVLAYFQKPSERYGCHLPRWMKELILLEAHGADRIIWLDCDGIEMKYDHPGERYHHSRQTIYEAYGTKS